MVLDQIRNTFASKAGVKEISIHTERKSSDKVAEEIKFKLIKR